MSELICSVHLTDILNNLDRIAKEQMRSGINEKIDILFATPTPGLVVHMLGSCYSPTFVLERYGVKYQAFRGKISIGKYPYNQKTTNGFIGIAKTRIERHVEEGGIKLEFYTL